MPPRRSPRTAALALCATLLFCVSASSSVRADQARTPATTTITPHAHQSFDTSTAAPAPGLSPGAPARSLAAPKRSLAPRAARLPSTPATSAPRDPEVLGFAQDGEVSSGAWRADLRLGLLTTIAYFGVNVYPDGSLVTNDAGYATWRSQAATDMINAAHAAGDRVVLTVKDFDNGSIASVTNSEQNRQRLVGAIVGELASRGGDGVNLDFEGGGGDSPAAYTTLVAELRNALTAQLPAQAYLTVDTYGSSATGGTMMDIPALSPHVDAFDVMAYDTFSPSSGVTGPVAPLNGNTYSDTNEVNQYLAQIPPSQLILGVPYYAVKWSVLCNPRACNGSDQTVAGSGGDAIYSDAMSDLANCAGAGSVSWQPVYAAHFAVWPSPQANPYCSHSGPFRELYYDDPGSLGQKYDLVNARQLRGIGIWALGYDSGHGELWDEIAAKFSVTHAPQASVDPLPQTEGSTSFTVSWSPLGGSPPASHVAVFVSDGGGPYTQWLDSTARSATFVGWAGHSYSFVAQAFGPGNVSAGRPAAAQATTTVSASAPRTTPFGGLYGVDADGTLVPGSSPPQPSAVWPGLPIVRGIAVAPGGHTGYTLDAFGGVHPYGGSPLVPITGYWPGWDICRGIALRSDGVSGYVLDAFGGVHPFGGAPAVAITGYWPGWDIARAITLRPDGVSGWVLDGWGGIHPFGGAPGLAPGGYWPGWDIARSLAVTPDGAGGYSLDGWGGVHPFGSAPPTGLTAYWPGWDIARGLTLLPQSSSAGYTLDGWGGIHPFGGAPNVVLSQYTPGRDLARGIADG